MSQQHPDYEMYRAFLRHTGEEPQKKIFKTPADLFDLKKWFKGQARFYPDRVGKYSSLFAHLGIENSDAGKRQIWDRYQQCWTHMKNSVCITLDSTNKKQKFLENFQTYLSAPAPAPAPMLQLEAAPAPMLPLEDASDALMTVSPDAMVVAGNESSGKANDEKEVCSYGPIVLYDKSIEYTAGEKTGNVLDGVSATKKRNGSRSGSKRKKKKRKKRKHTPNDGSAEPSSAAMSAPSAAMSAPSTTPDVKTKKRKWTKSLNESDAPSATVPEKKSGVKLVVKGLDVKEIRAMFTRVIRQLHDKYRQDQDTRNIFPQGGFDIATDPLERTKNSSSGKYKPNRADHMDGKTANAWMILCENQNDDTKEVFGPISGIARFTLMCNHLGATNVRFADPYAYGGIVTYGTTAPTLRFVKRRKVV